VRYLDEDDVRRLLRWDELIPAMEAVLAAFSRGRVIQPVRNMLTIEEGKRYVAAMPAVTEEAMGAKLVSFYPGNAGSGVATHHAVIMLMRTDTGEPIAAMDGRLITEMRTAAVSAVATNCPAPADAGILAQRRRVQAPSALRFTGSTGGSVAIDFAFPSSPFIRRLHAAARACLHRV